MWTVVLMRLHGWTVEMVHSLIYKIRTLVLAEIWSIVFLEGLNQQPGVAKGQVSLDEYANHLESWVFSQGSLRGSCNDLNEMLHLAICGNTHKSAIGRH